MLYPLFSKHAWTGGSNAAVCRLSPSPTHVPPEPDCTCGFYAYADERGAREYPFARHVLAVVACWGRVIAGTRGIRAQYGRIESVWLSDQVPADLVAMVVGRYPTVKFYTDREEMLAAHPLTALDSYADQNTSASLGQASLAARLVAGLALVAGLLPTSVISGLPFGWWAWFAVALALVAGAIVPLHRRTDPTQRRRRLLCVALFLWMIAPLPGVAGVLFLRLPLLQIAVLFAVHRAALNRLARTFPAPI